MKPRDGFGNRMIELPLDVWAALDAMKSSSGVGVAVLLEDAARRYTTKPPKKLPEPRKRGRKPKPPEGGQAG